MAIQRIVGRSWHSGVSPVKNTPGVRSPPSYSSVIVTLAAEPGGLTRFRF